MTFRLPVQLLVVLATGSALLARPVAGRTYVACADGTPCPLVVPAAKAPAAPAHACCPPAPCDAHAAAPADAGGRCVVKVRPPVDYAAPPAASAPAPPDALALLPDPIAVVPVPAPASAVPAPVHAPPWHHAPGQGHGPRAPPSR